MNGIMNGNGLVNLRSNPFGFLRSVLWSVTSGEEKVVK